MRPSYRFLELRGGDEAVFGDHIWGEHLAAFKAVYGRAKVRVGKDLEALAQQYLQHANSKSIWFGCDCRPDTHPRPLLKTDKRDFVARMERGAERAPHSPECVFFRNKEQQQKYVKANRPPDIQDRFLIHKPFRNADRTSPRRDLTTEARVDRSNRPSSLQRLLWILLSEARLNVHLPGAPWPTAEQQIAKIRSVVAGKLLHPSPLLPERQVCLEQVFCFEPKLMTSFAVALKQTPDAIDSMNDYWARRDASAQGGEGPDANPAAPFRPWPAGVRPQGFILLLVNEVQGHELHYAGMRESIIVDGRLAIFGEEPNAARRGPYLALLSLTQLSAKKPWIGVTEAYLHPVINAKHWMPVDSDYERHTFNCLKSAQYRCLQAGRKFTIMKPLFNLNGDQEEATEVIIPDFVVRLGTGDDGAKLLIETMGYREAWYQQDKARIHPLMEMVTEAKVVRYDAYERPLGEQGDEWDRVWRRDCLYPLLDCLI